MAVMICREEQGRLEEQKKFLDQEMEKILQQRLKMEQLEKVRRNCTFIDCMYCFNKDSLKKKLKIINPARRSRTTDLRITV